MTSPQIDQPLQPADGEHLGVAFLLPQMRGLNVATQLPPTPDNRTRPDPFLRIEFGGGSQVNKLEFDLDLILLSYHPDEKVASSNCGRGFGLMAAASGVTVDGWYIGWARGTSLPHRSTDPKVSLPRYRAMVTWRMPGQLILP